MTWGNLLTMWYNLRGAAEARGRIVQGTRSPVGRGVSAGGGPARNRGPGGSFLFYLSGHFLAEDDAFSGFFRIPGFTFYQEGVGNFGQFPSDGSSAGLLALSPATQSFVVNGDLRIMLSGAGRSQEEGHFQHAVTLVGHLGAGLEFSALVHSGIEATVADEVSDGGEAADIPGFSQDDGGGEGSDAGDGGKGLVRKMFPEEAFDFPIDGGDEVVLLEDLGGQVLEDKLFGGGEFLKGCLLSYGQEFFDVSGAWAMSGAKAYFPQALFTGFEEECGEGKRAREARRPAGSRLRAISW